MTTTVLRIVGRPLAGFVAIGALRRGKSRPVDPLAQALALMIGLAPRPWNTATFLRRLSDHLDRRVVVKSSEMPPNMTGLWMSTAATEYIFVTDSADCTRWLMIVAHEIAHMLLGHRYPVDLETPYNSATGFVPSDERDAESVATAFVAQIEIDARSSNIRYDGTAG